MELYKERKQEYKDFFKEKLLTFTEYKEAMNDLD
tara:strand:+ start:167 stop:268 length:102 start_codon:yes stop_codon:yes gene_type:complete